MDRFESKQKHWRIWPWVIGMPPPYRHFNSFQYYNQIQSHWALVFKIWSGISYLCHPIRSYFLGSLNNKASPEFTLKLELKGNIFWAKLYHMLM